jgi:hypothetical protein
MGIWNSTLGRLRRSIKKDRSPDNSVLTFIRDYSRKVTNMWNNYLNWISKEIITFADLI